MQRRRQCVAQVAAQSTVPNQRETLVIVSTHVPADAPSTVLPAAPPAPELELEFEFDEDEDDDGAKALSKLGELALRLPFAYALAEAAALDANAA